MHVERAEVFPSLLNFHEFKLLFSAASSQHQLICPFIFVSATNINFVYND